MQVRNYDESKLTESEASEVRKFIASFYGMNQSGDWARIWHEDLPVLLVYIPISKVPDRILSRIIDACE